MSEVAKQMKQLLEGATMDDLQAIIEQSMEGVRDGLGPMKEQRASLDTDDPKAAKLDEAIAATERVMASYDEMRAKAIEQVRKESSE